MQPSIKNVIYEVKIECQCILCINDILEIENQMYGTLTINGNNFRIKLEKPNGEKNIASIESICCQDNNNILGLNI